MPTRRPRQRAHDSYNNDEEEQQHGALPERDAPSSPPGRREERRQLAALVESRVGTPLGREPRSDSEKREVYLQLVRLKAARKTHKECADILGVSVSTIANYVADPLYKEMQAELVSEAKDRGHVLIGELIDFSLEKMVALTSAQSEFVRFKALEYILNAAGFNLPREERGRDNQDGLTKFMDLLSSSRGRAEKPTQATVVNVEVHTAGGGSDGAQPSSLSTIEGSLSFPSPQEGAGTAALPTEKTIPPELAQYYQQVLPGGKLPFGARGAEEQGG